MSTKYPGGFITKSPVAPTSTAASGVWTLDQQQQAQKAGTWPSPPMFIEDLFSTYLYTGNGSTQTITNGIDLAGNGGLVWLKERTANYTDGHWLEDTVRGPNKVIKTNTTGAQLTINNSVTAFNGNGFSIGANASFASTNYASWTFREQPKFFDIVTYTGNGDYSGSRLISHNLGTRGGAVIVKPVSATGDWKYTHINGAVLLLNSTEPRDTATTLAGGFPALNSSTDFALVPFGGSGSAVNANGVQYVAYLFAHDAGGFPASGTGSTNGISCGSYTGTGAAGNAINLGYEPQWVMIKNATNVASWQMFDVMRGMPVPASGNTTRRLQANTSSAEFGLDPVGCFPTATGFTLNTANGDFNASGDTYIYIAIRRGPMKVPTDGTKVYTSIARAGTGVTTAVTGADFPPDFAMIANYKSGSPDHCVFDKLRSPALRLRTARTDAEANFLNDLLVSFNMDGITVGPDSQGETNNNTDPSWRYVNHLFRRAPGFFDVVCYTGTGYSSTQTLTHNLSVTPELMIAKDRTTGGGWGVYSATLGATKYLQLNEAFAEDTSQFFWGNTSPTSTQFTVRGGTNIGGSNFVAYLFATCPGVSKVGSFTGTGATQVINCGFAGGARFVLIKATSTTGNWYVWDSARGIVAGNDPYLLLNSTAAEVTNTDWVDTATSGFELSNAGGNLANSNGVSYIFLAIS